MRKVIRPRPTRIAVVNTTNGEVKDHTMNIMFLGNDDFAEMWINDPDIYEKLHDFDSTIAFDYDYQRFFHPKDIVGTEIYEDVHVTELVEVMTLEEYGYDFTEEINAFNSERRVKQ